MENNLPDGLGNNLPPVEDTLCAKIVFIKTLIAGVLHYGESNNASGEIHEISRKSYFRPIHWSWQSTDNPPAEIQIHLESENELGNNTGLILSLGEHTEVNCYDFALLFHCCAKRSRLESRIINGDINDSSHFWNEVKINGTWETVEPQISMCSSPIVAESRQYVPHTGFHCLTNAQKPNEPYYWVCDDVMYRFFDVCAEIAYGHYATTLLATTATPAGGSTAYAANADNPGGDETIMAP